MASVIRGDDNFDSADMYAQPTTVGAVGTYALLGVFQSGAINSPGITKAGSELRYANSGDLSAAAWGGLINSAPSGTWWLMGNTGHAYNGSFATSTSGWAYVSSVWLRIS